MRSLVLLLWLIATHGVAQTLDPPKLVTEQNGRITNIHLAPHIGTTKSGTSFLTLLAAGLTRYHSK